MTVELKITMLQEESRGESWRVVQVHGEPRTYHLEQLAEILNQVASVANGRVWIRFEDATWVDSSVLQLLIRTGQNAKRVGGEIRIEFPEELYKTMPKPFRRWDDDGWTAGVPARLPVRPRPPLRGQERLED